MFVGLRFPTPPTSLADVIERRFLCLAAQRQADADADVTAPDGVEIVFVPQPIALYHTLDALKNESDPAAKIANGLSIDAFLGPGPV